MIGNFRFELFLAAFRDLSIALQTFNCQNHRHDERLCNWLQEFLPDLDQTGSDQMNLVRPGCVIEALDALSQPSTKAIAGGTALQLTWEAGAEKPGCLVDLSTLPELAGISTSAAGLTLGASTPLAVLLSDPIVHKHLPLLTRAARDVAGPSVRTMGTLGGQIGWGSGCLLPALLMLNASVTHHSLTGARHSTPLLDYLALTPTQQGLIEAIEVALQPAGARWVWRKVGLRAAFTLGVIAVAGMISTDGPTIRSVRLAAGSGATPPQRLTKLENALTGEPVTSLDEAVIARAISAPSDALRSAGYRKKTGARALVTGLLGSGPPTRRSSRMIPPMPAKLPDGETFLGRCEAGQNWHIRPDLQTRLDGRSAFLTDLRSPGMLVGRILRSNYPHARILSIETSKAEALAGVHAVVTHRDIRGQNGFGIIIQDQPALCFDMVRYEGDPVAAVAAETAQIAEKALSLIDVRYEPLPVIDDPHEALKDTSPQLHDDGNVRKTVELERGDIDAGFAAATHIVEDVYVTPRQMHGFTETEGGVVEPTDTGGLIVKVGGQHGARDRMQLSRILGIGEEKIEVVTSPTGGGFGGKDELTVQPAMALLALKSGRPVRLNLSRKESARAGIKRNAFHIRMKTGCDATGKLVAQQVEAIADGGAYASLSLGVIETAMEHACGPYIVPNIKTRGRLVATNNGTCGAFRGFGCNEMTFAVESQIERLAQLVGMDGVALRRKNIRQPGTPGYLGQRVAPTERLSEMLDAASTSLLWTEPQGLSEDGQSFVGTGMALCYQGNGLGTLSDDEGEMELALVGDGKIEARYGLDEMGQGLVPAIQSCVADVLGIARDDIRPVFGDTRLSPDTGSTTASRGTYMVWKGAQLAGPRFTAQVLTLASTALTRSPERLTLVPGGVGEAGSNSLTPLISFTELAGQSAPETLPQERQHFVYPKTEYAEANAHLLYISGVAIIRAAVDRDTGMVRILDLVQYTASGPVLDIASYLGQMEGAAGQGQGMTLSEHVIMQAGRAVTLNFDTYVMPGIADRSMSSKVYAFGDLDAGDVYGPRGVGELGIAGTAPAIGNAIAAALGLDAAKEWPSILPLSPETLMEMME